MSVTTLWIVTAALAAQPSDEAKTASPNQPIRVLSVTGLDSAAHQWKPRSDAITTVLNQDKRFQVAVTQDPESLAAADLSRFDVLFFHFRNLKPFAQAKRFQDNLTGFVRRGGGLVLLHGASGAFPDWPEYRRLAGRYWGKTVGHDRRGPFPVKIVDPRHPVTRGMEDFQADDELYCYLVGEEPIHVLASARSQSTGRNVPVAFVLEYGDGRVFHCPLGHDAKAVLVPGVAELLRRGCAWAAGQEP
jgi:type 1 glutamine amidotransferase